QKKAISAYRFSKEIGISQSTLSDWKRGRSTPKQDKLQKIADYFSVTLEYLMTGEVSKDNILVPQNEKEKEILILCRQTDNMPEEYREKMYSTLKDTIGLYLKATGKEE
ncbi:MAG: helix-turn-helix domain-containing protein, partial [Anaerotignaceae bacterium]